MNNNIIILINFYILSYNVLVFFDAIHLINKIIYYYIDNKYRPMCYKLLCYLYVYLSSV